ncbi:MAG: ATP-binding protein [Muribaculaceae bacterium]|nr:ATP-binding protein [Muribaculaceae bacterium]
MKFLNQQRTILFIILLIIASSYNIYANNSQPSKKVLIITSYTADSERVTDFISILSNVENDNNYNYDFIMENLDYRGIYECKTWSNKLRRVLNKYNSQNLKSIILLGQEAWSTYLTLDSVPNAPFYGCYISERGITINNTPNDLSEWFPESKNMRLLAIDKGRCCGALMNRYDIENNIKLVQLLYPSVNKVAILTDNTYGGLSLLGHFKETVNTKFKNITPIYLDGSKLSPSDIKQQISNFDNTTAILIGTWRIDNNGTFILNGSVDNLIPGDSQIPILTVTGVGLKSIALGGNIPNYDYDIKRILSDIYEYEHNTSKKPIFRYTSNRYIFNQSKMDQFGIKPFEIPSDSEIISPDDDKIKQYKDYLIYGSIILIVFISALILSISLFCRLKRMNKILSKQKEELDNQTKAIILAKEKAEESDKLKSTFLANMSHEIRTPLNAIVGFSELMKDGSVDERNEYWSIINDNNELLLRLINDILDLSKIEAGMIELKHSPFDMVKCIQNIYLTLSKRFDIKDDKVKFKISIPCDICIINKDQNRIMQLYTNFVTNAFKFTFKGHITIGFELLDNGIKLFCEDTGVGIEKENIPKVFERFYKLNDFAQGTGLGMAICKAIVEAEGGTIGIDSSPGSGSTFWAIIPCDYECNKER